MNWSYQIWNERARRLERTSSCASLLSELILAIRNSTRATFPRFVGGITPACTEIGRFFYSQALEGDPGKLDSCRRNGQAVGEYVPDDQHRSRERVGDDVRRHGINIWEVIDAAATKPFGFMSFYPGPGLGGHCIPIDPFCLSWKSKQAGIDAFHRIGRLHQWTDAPFCSRQTPECTQ
jgi:hypothetical protein